MNKTTPLLIAVDGPAASGKGTLAKKIAETYKLDYLDTGSLYRAVGFKILEQKSDPHDQTVAIEATKSITPYDLNNSHLYDEGVGAAASIVAVIPEVRDILLDYQKQIAASPNGAVLDGRDIGTVVCPDAHFKFYIFASLEARAERRFKQLQNKGFPIIYESILDDLQRRDERDSQREIAPLRCASDAIHIDTTDMNIAEVLIEACTFIDKTLSSLPT